MPQYRVNESYREIATRLVDKFKDVRHVCVGSIAFVDNEDGKGQSKGKTVYARISTIPEKLQPLLKDKAQQYVIEVFKVSTMDFSREQLVLAIYHELKHIALDGNLVGHDVEEWNSVLATVGAGWTETRMSLPDLLGEGFDWTGVEPAQRLLGTTVTLSSGGTSVTTTAEDLERAADRLDRALGRHGATITGPGGEVLADIPKRGARAS
jgi:predicted metallopeptidase